MVAGRTDTAPIGRRGRDELILVRHTGEFVGRGGRAAAGIRAIATGTVVTAILVAVHILLVAPIVGRPSLFSILIVAIVRVIVVVCMVNGWRRYLRKVLLIRWMMVIVTVVRLLLQRLLRLLLLMHRIRSITIVGATEWRSLIEVVVLIVIRVVRRLHAVRL